VKGLEALDDLGASVEVGMHSPGVPRKTAVEATQAQEAGFLDADVQEHHRVALEVGARASGVGPGGTAMAVTQLQIAEAARLEREVGMTGGTGTIPELHSRKSAVARTVIAVGRRELVEN